MIMEQNDRSFKKGWNVSDSYHGIVWVNYQSTKQHIVKCR